MAGWTNAKRNTVELAFYKYLDRCYVNSKDAPNLCLGKALYQGQIDCVTEIFDALEADIHNIYVLKSRQLGISTIIRALVIFLLGVHHGLKGAIVFDTDNNKQNSRAEIKTMIDDLPVSLRFPRIKSDNRAGLTLDNDSSALFMSAGVKKSKASGTLGRSVGLSVAHCSELCSWDNDDGLEAFQNSLSDINPDRLYIYESTARGFNRWWEMWEEARKDPHHCRCVFLGWWSKDTQRIDRDTVDWNLYGVQPPTDKELVKIKEVREKYSVEVSMEQLAWYRRKMDPSATKEGDAELAFEGSTMRIQEQPWTEEEAFQQTGAVFFDDRDLTGITQAYASKKFKTYMYIAGQEFSQMRIAPAANAKSVELKVWEAPDIDGAYVMGIDPAYGENEFNARSSIQVLRCYADGLDQVAEYAWPLVNTRQFAWVIASLLGWYGFGRAEMRYILELNGPGTAVFNELKSLKFQLENAQYKDLEEKGLADVFKNVKTYIYSRPDSMGAGSNWHFVTTSRLKVTLMEQLRDVASNGKLRIRSHETLQEMRSIAREGDKIGAPGSLKDDRVMAMAMAVYYWTTKIRNNLISTKRTRSAEEARKNQSIVDQVAFFNQNNLEMFFKTKQAQRGQRMLAAQYNQWRYGASRRY